MNMYRTTCNSHPQQQRDVDLVLQKRLLCTAASCGYHTNVATSEKDLQQSECSPCKSAYENQRLDVYRYYALKYVDVAILYYVTAYSVATS